MGENGIEIETPFMKTDERFFNRTLFRGREA
jgi:hypothetical protein